jgi:hypothetical protein
VCKCGKRRYEGNPRTIPLLSCRQHLGDLFDMLQYFKAIRPASAATSTVDEAPSGGSITMELHAQVRNNGRILGGTRHVLKGQDLEAVFKMSKLSSDEEMWKWTMHMCRHPRSIILRSGMLSNHWTDLVEIFAAREADLTNERGGIVTPGEFLRRLDEDDVSLLAAEDRIDFFNLFLSNSYKVILSDRSNQSNDNQHCHHSENRRGLYTESIEL